MKKKEKWMKPRHKVVRDIVFSFLGPFTRLRYGVTVEKFRQQGDRAYLILMNHQTPFDQFFVGMAFRGAVYYLATEDLFSNGWVSSLIRWLVAPIAIKKQTTDISAVMNCLRVAREGGTLAMAPEGNRTYSGTTEYINPAVASMAKKMKLPIALFRIEGGYGVEPRWADGPRKGKMRAYVSRVIEPEEYADISNEELFSWIREGLYVDEAVADAHFLSSRRAEYLERAIYVCPDCGLAEHESHGCGITCRRCGKTVFYGTDKTLTAKEGTFPFRFVKEWYDYQQSFVNGLDVTAMTQQPLFRDRAKMSEVILNKRKRLLRKQAELSLYGDRIVVGEGTPEELIFQFSQVEAITVLGRNKLNIYYDKMVYQFKGDKRFNALKYVNFCFRYRNITRGRTEETFLGI